MVIKLGSLFDGIGGFPFAASCYGVEPVWASEIEPFPVKVTKHHFPDMRHLGDITQINGGEIEPVDIVTFGSPCQDLSVAGKREGLAGERSGLFSHAVRIIRQMRESTGGQFPRFAVWENVPGAYSSNKGQDFRAVLEEIAEAEIPMPESGKWAEAGMVRIGNCDIAWRTLDAQYWGVPQRRKRIFLVADFTGQCAGEILFIEKGLRGDFTESGETREEIAGAVGDGVKTAIWDIGDRRRVLESRGISPSLLSKMGTGGNNVPIVLSRINCTPEGITGAVSSKWAKGTGGPAGDEHYNLVAVPQLYDMTHADEVIRPVQEGIAPTLNSRMGTGGNQVPVMLEPIPIHDKATRYKGGGPTRKNDGAANGFGVGKPGDPMNTLGTSDRHAVAFQPGNLSRQAGAEPSTEVFPTLGAATLGDQFPHVAFGVDYRNLYENDELSATIQAKPNGGQSLNYINPVRQGYAVRRLTPTECLRLQGFPDWWLDIEGASDTAKYKAIGNSVAIPCVDFVMSGIARVLRRVGRYRGQKIDLYMDSEHECWQWGRRQVEVRVIEP